MTTRREMTARILQLWADNMDPEDIDRRVRIEYCGEPSSVHDAAWTAAISLTARRIGNQLRDLIAKAERHHGINPKAMV